ncbi:hypothetical protein SAY86_003296 [Trapa natans]|uniref:PB1 domain-containing protein n=1 Tax=Trapa natans TaxID=22666 RepID=A0AAN7REU1_TRANT|nr:hypothetical protein SAY86_003296 [Trapa natans]
MMVSGSGEEAASAPMSPKNKVKFLCSHGGKILPRPGDGHLKYVGGETRIVSIPHGTLFSELMKKLSALFEGDMILKYQLAAEDLDALVSVKSDEDLKHMFDEHDRHASLGSPMLRAFLFPTVATVVEIQSATSLDPHALEQRYIDAVNGIIRVNPSPNASLHPPQKALFGPHSPGRVTFSISSACSSPKSLSRDSNPEYASLAHDAASLRSYHGNNNNNNHVHPMMHKVQSSPVLYGLGNVPHGGHGTMYSPNHQQYGHYYGPNHHHSHQHPSSYHPPRPLHMETYRGTGHDKLPAGGSMAGRVDIGKSPMILGMGPHYMGGRSYRAGGGNNLGYSDDYGSYGYRRHDRDGSLPQSPKMAVWEGQCYNKGEQS